MFIVYKQVVIHPVVIGATGAIAERTTDSLRTLELACKVGWLQKLVAMETRKIVKNLL